MSEKKQEESILDQELQIFMKEIYDYLTDKKVKDILIFDLSSVNPYFNFFIIGTVMSSLHLKSTVRQMQKVFADKMPERKSGFRKEDLESGWVIVDFVDPVVHLFLEDERSYYNLERLWGDAKQYTFTN
ncbi:MAG: ribosome silencing factor [Spirochaetia bacterium]|nr:ribosome silencing factor [Spirochaetia bacterium]